MTLKEMLILDLDYFENVEDGQELADCRDIIVGDMIALRRIEYGNEIVGPVQNIEQEAVERVMEMYKGL